MYGTHQIQHVPTSSIQQYHRHEIAHRDMYGSCRWFFLLNTIVSRKLTDFLINIKLS